MEYIYKEVGSKNEKTLIEDILRRYFIKERRKDWK